MKLSMAIFTKKTLKSLFLQAMATENTLTVHNANGGRFDFLNSHYVFPSISFNPQRFAPLAEKTCVRIALSHLSD